MTALTTYKVAYKALRAAWSGCHLQELRHPANQDLAQGLIQREFAGLCGVVTIFA